MKLIDITLLDQLTTQAQENPRLRMNYNLHESLDSKAQRLLNALEPGTFLPIHRHQNTSETYILLRGKLSVLFYNEKGELTETSILDHSSENFGVHISAGQWHTIEVLESGTVIFEVKEGPYKPLTNEDMLK
ncbi:MAG: WbuC family cupin fold metalloprotein [Paludibacteraceae bacterium]